MFIREILCLFVAKCFMPEAIENYIPQDFAVELRRQAYFVWSISGLIVLVWLLLIVLAPIAEANNSIAFSRPIYKFFGFICHQMPDRSLHVYEHAFAVCSRCFGVYFGLFFGFVVYPLIRQIDEIEPFARFWLFLALIPMGIDWSLGFFEIWENTHFSRFSTGAILGVTCGLFIVPALVELFQVLTSRKKGKKLSN